MVNSNHTTFEKNDVDANNSNSTSLIVKPANLYLLFNRFSNFSPEQKNGPENVVNSDYYDNKQFQALKFHEKISQYLYFT